MGLKAETFLCLAPIRRSNEDWTLANLDAEIARTLSFESNIFAYSERANLSVMPAM